MGGVRWLLVIIGLLFCVSSALAVPVILYDQGSGVTANSSALATGDITVSIWTAATSGIALYNNTFSGGIINGTWAVQLSVDGLEYGKTYYKDYAINGVDMDFDGDERLGFMSPLGLINNQSFVNGSAVGGWTSNGTITSTMQNVGIGTTSPQVSFEVNGSGGGNYAGFPSLVNVRIKDDLRWGLTYQNDAWGSNNGVGWFLGNGGKLVFATWNGSRYFEPLSLFGTSGYVAIGEYFTPNAQLHIQSRNSTTKPLIVQGKLGQSTNLQEWQNSSGAALAYVNSSGSLFVDNGSQVCTQANGLCASGSADGTGGWTNDSASTRTALRTIINSSSSDGSFIIQNTSGSTHFIINGSDGKIGFGGLPSQNAKLNVITNGQMQGGYFSTSSDSTQGNMYGIQTLTSYTGSSSFGPMVGVKSTVTSSNNNGMKNISEMTGVDGAAGATGDNANISILRGLSSAVYTGYGMVQFHVDNFSGLDTLLFLGSGDVNIRNAYGIKVPSPTKGGAITGVLQNIYGVYIGNHSGLGFTNSYNLYSAGANTQNVFEGNVSVNGSLIVNNSLVCTAANGLCGSSSFNITGMTTWLLASSDGQAAVSVTNGTVINITGGNGVTVTRSATTLQINSTTQYQSSAVGWTNTSTTTSTNLNVNLTGVLHLTPQATPGGASEGDIFFSSTLHKPCYYNSTHWVTFDGNVTC